MQAAVAEFYSRFSQPVPHIAFRIALAHCASSWQARVKVGDVFGGAVLGFVEAGVYTTDKVESHDSHFPMEVTASSQ